MPVHKSVIHQSLCTWICACSTKNQIKLRTTSDHVYAQIMMPQPSKKKKRQAHSFLHKMHKYWNAIIYGINNHNFKNNNLKLPYANDLTNVLYYREGHFWWLSPHPHAVQVHLCANVLYEWIRHYLYVHRFSATSRLCVFALISHLEMHLLANEAQWEPCKSCSQEFIRHSVLHVCGIWTLQLIPPGSMSKTWSNNHIQYCKFRLWKDNTVSLL